MNSPRALDVLLLFVVALACAACDSSRSSGSVSEGPGLGAGGSVGFSTATLGAREGAPDIEISVALELLGDVLESDTQVDITVGSSSTAAEGIDLGAGFLQPPDSVPGNGYLGPSVPFRSTAGRRSGCRYGRRWPLLTGLGP